MGLLSCGIQHEPDAQPGTVSRVIAATTASVAYQMSDQAHQLPGHRPHKNSPRQLHGFNPHFTVYSREPDRVVTQN